MSNLYRIMTVLIGKKIVNAGMSHRDNSLLLEIELSENHVFAIEIETNTKRVLVTLHRGSQQIAQEVKLF